VRELKDQMLKNLVRNSRFTQAPRSMRLSGEDPLSLVSSERDAKVQGEPDRVQGWSISPETVTPVSQLLLLRPVRPSGKARLRQFPPSGVPLPATSQMQKVIAQSRPACGSLQRNPPPVLMILLCAQRTRTGPVHPAGGGSTLLRLAPGLREPS